MPSRCRRLAAVAVLAACAPAAPGARAALDDAHAAAIRDSIQVELTRFQTFSATGQFDSLGNMYSDAPGFRFAESGVVQYGSAGAVRAALARVPAGNRIETTYRETEIDPLAPGLANVSTLFETAFVDGAGTRFSFGGALTMTWAHEAAGWRIRGGHSSAPVPRGP